jgi:murein DD-endopeptidase MepM/ murein hydrolase activator NlpD
MARWPTSSFVLAGTRDYGAVRRTPADGGCGIGSYPCTHYGMDLVPKDGDSRVFAPESGTIVDIAFNTTPYVGYGPSTINMRGVSGQFHLLAHLDPDTIAVQPGQKVLEGTLLARFDAAHAHTHYEVRKQRIGPNATNTIDPKKWQASNSIFGQAVTLGLLIGAGWLSYKIWKGEAL